MKKIFVIFQVPSGGTRTLLNRGNSVQTSDDEDSTPIDSFIDTDPSVEVLHAVGEGDTNLVRKRNPAAIILTIEALTLARDGGILDWDDQVSDVLDDRELVRSFLFKSRHKRFPLFDTLFHNPSL